MIELFLKELFAPVKIWFEDFRKYALPALIGAVGAISALCGVSYITGLICFHHWNMVEKNLGETGVLGFVVFGIFAIIFTLSYWIVSYIFKIGNHIYNCYQDAKILSQLNPFEEEDDNCYNGDEK